MKINKRFIFEKEDLKNVQKQLIDKGIDSIRNLAKAIGYSHTYVWMVLKGKKSVSIDFIKKLKELDISI